MGLWTQRVRLTWPPSLTFFEHRYEVLRQFEQMGLLQQFRVREQRLSARLGDAYHFISISPDELEAGLLRPSGEFHRVENALRITFDLLKPQRVVRPLLSFQWLFPVGEDYDSARLRASTSMLGDLPPLERKDPALFFAASTHAGDVVNIECGIVEAAETPQRLARQVGQFTSFADAEAPPSLWPVDSVPNVAFFCDSIWHMVILDDPTPDAVFKSWENMRASTENIVTSLADRLALINA